MSHFVGIFAEKICTLATAGLRHLAGLYTRHVQRSVTHPSLTPSLRGMCGFCSPDGCLCALHRFCVLTQRKHACHITYCVCVGLCAGVCACVDVRSWGHACSWLGLPPWCAVPAHERGVPTLFAVYIACLGPWCTASGLLYRIQRYNAPHSCCGA
jgi:hypothetical protein